MSKQEQELEHAILQEDAYYRHTRSTMLEYERALNQVNRLAEQKETLEQQVQKELSLREEVNRRFAEIRAKTEANASLPSYEHEYSARQSYYKLSLGEYDCFDWHKANALSRPKHPIVVLPDSISYGDKRTDNLFERLSVLGAICFQHHPSVAAHTFASHARGFYTFSDEVYLLAWLLHHRISPIVLCNWVLQAAWYDLIPDVKLWYDIFEGEAYLFHHRTDHKLKHWSLLREARAVSHSAENNRYLAYYRKDAQYIPSDLTDDADYFLLRLIGDKEHAEPAQ